MTRSRRFAAEQAVVSAPKRFLFRSPLAHVYEAPLPEGVFGYTNHAVTPTEVVITSSAGVPSGRKRIALVHEILHVLVRLHKISLSHDQLHALSIALTQELVESLPKFEQLSSKQ